MQIPVDTLNNALKKLSFCLQGSGIGNYEGKIFLEGDSVCAFNGRFFCRTELDTGISCCLDAKLFMAYCSKIGGSAELTLQENSLLVTSGRSKASFAAVVMERPSIFDSLDVAFTACPGLGIAVQEASQAISQNFSDIRAYLVHVTPDYAEATDEARIIRRKLKLPRGTDFFIPYDFCAAMDSMQPEEMHVGDEMVCFRKGGDLFGFLKVKCEQYYDLQKILNECQKGEPIVFPDSLYDSLQKAAVLQSTCRFEADRKVVIRTKDGKLKLESKNDQARFSEVFRFAGNAQITIVINPSYLAQLLEKSCKAVYGPGFLRIFDDTMDFVTVLRNE